MTKIKLFTEDSVNCGFILNVIDKMMDWLSDGPVKISNNPVWNKY